MNLSKIKNDLQQVLQLVEDWHAKGVDELERDIALGKLREIYSEVRFDAAPQPETITSETETAPCEQDEKNLNESSQPEVEQMPIGVAISLDDVFEGFIPEELMPASVEETLESESEEEAIAESDEVEEDVEIEEDEESTEDSIEEEESPESVDDEADFEETEMEQPEEVEPMPIVDDVEEIESVEEESSEQIESDIEPTEDVEPIEEDNQKQISTKEETTPVEEESPKQSVVVESANVGQASLFGDDELFVPRPSRRTKMMSLYDDEPRTEVIITKNKEVATPIPTPVPQPVEQPTQSANYEIEVLEEEDEFVEVNVETIPLEEASFEEHAAEEESVMTESTAVEIEPETTPAEPYVEPQIEVAVTRPTTSVVPESEQVLGEVIKSDVQTIADTIKPKDTAAEQIVKNSVDDISKAVGINDRFLLIRDLFGGDSGVYERVMAKLNSFDNLDDCMIHIVENYDWNPNSDGAKLIMELLERKYS